MEAVFEIERETKNTVRYREVEGEEPAKVGTIYVQKWALRKLNGGAYPQKIRVTIDEA